MTGSPTDEKLGGLPRFELLRQLGSGSLGVVYEAFDRERGERVALKTLRGVDRSHLVALKNEYRSLRELVHPNLVALGELIEHQGAWFFTMELVEGSDFLDHVRPGGAPAFDVLEDGIAQLAGGLAYLHDHGKVHRDVKPSNIRVTPDGRAVLLDFGLVIEQDSSDDIGVVVGTPAYMAPEQARGKAVGPEADVYALGVVLYEALTGDVPFARDGAASLGLRKNAVDPPAPSAMLAGVPPHMDVLCVRMLARRPAQRPTAREVAGALARGDAREGPPIGPPAAALVGRRAELERLFELLDRARTGSSCAAYIRGESGVGKTELVRQFAAAARDSRDDVVVLGGRCYERETVPYKALDEIVDTMATELAELAHDRAAALGADAHLAATLFPALRRITTLELVPAPDLGSIDPTVARRRAFDALCVLLDALLGERTALLYIDDVHGADDDSLALLVHLLARMNGRCALVLTALARGLPGEDAVPAWIPYPTETIELDAMSPADARALASRLLERAGRPAEDAASIAETAAGHPLFIHELALRTAATQLPPAGIADLIWERVQAQERRARRALAVLAIAGIPLEQRVLAATAQIEFPEFHQVVDRLRDAHLVRTGGALRTDAIEVYHNSVRATLLDHTDDTALVRLHQRYAETLEQTDPDNVSSLAYHWLAAGALDRAFDCMVDAAERAERSLAFDRAAGLYAAALDIGTDTDAGVRRLRAKLGAALFNSGRAYAGAQQYLAAAQGSSDVVAAELARRGAAALLGCGHVDAGMRVLGDIMDALGLHVPEGGSGAHRHERLRVAAFRSVDPASVDPRDQARIDACCAVAAGLADIDPRTAARFQRHHLDLAFESGDSYRFGRSLAYEAILAAARGDGSQRRRAERALTQLAWLTSAADSPHLCALETLAQAALATHHGEWRRGAGLAARTENTLRDECSGVAAELVAARLLRFTCMVHMGELAPLLQMVTAALANAEQRGDRYATAMLNTGAVNLAWLVARSPDEARDRVDDAMRAWPDTPVYLQHGRALVSRINIELYTGDAEAALGIIERDWPRVVDSVATERALLRVDLSFARGRAALAADAHPDWVRAEAKQLEREDALHAGGAAQLLRAGAAARAGEDEAAIRHLERAQAAFSRLGMPIYAEAAGFRLGDERSARKLKTLGVIDPAAAARVLVPGFK